MSSRGKGRGRGKRLVPPAETNGLCDRLENLSVPFDVVQNHQTQGRGKKKVSQTVTRDPCTRSENLPIPKFDVAPKQFEDAESLPKKSYQTGTGHETPLVTKQKLVKARKPGYGTSKRKEIRVVTNFFKISSKKQNIYHYDIEIVLCDRIKQQSRINSQPKSLNKEICHQVLFEYFKKYQNLEQFFPVYDGKKNIFTSKPMPVNGEDVLMPVVINSKTKYFSVTIKPVLKKDGTNIISPDLLEKYESGEDSTFPEVIRLVYEAVFSHRRLNSPQIKCGLSFFHMQQKNPFSLGDGLEILQGYSQNIRFTEIGSAVLINVATSVFHKSGPIINYISELLNRKVTPDSFLNKHDITWLNKKLYNVRIQVTHDSFKRKYYINRISYKTARDHTFPIKLGTSEYEINVEDYFRQHYKKQLKFNKLPLLEMRGSKGKEVLIPFEVCNLLPGQRKSNRDLDGRKTAAMIKHTAVPPDSKFRQIQNYANNAFNDSKDARESFGLGMDLQPVALNIRVLGQPIIKYASNEVKPLDQGVWEIKRNNFLESASIKNWAIINFTTCNKPIIDKLSKFLIDAASNAGLKLPTPAVYPSSDRSVKDSLVDAKNQNAELVVVVFSKRDPNHLYQEIKYVSDIELGLPCQCVEESVVCNVKRFDMKVAFNICLKINAKLEGLNHTLLEWPLALEADSVIVIGADVVHSLNLTCSSVAAVVGCIDYNLCKYAVTCRALSNPKQNGKNQEIILTLDEMIKSILLNYYRATKRKPGKIIFYRDGISEGQFQKALDTEIPLVKKGCRSLQETLYEPPITYVVVQKRIQFRMKPENPSDGIGRMGNVPSGSICDRDIVDPQNYDFYLVSHEGIQGTSKPIYYTVLYDENGVKPNVIQTLTHYLCFVYARCNRSISIPAPVKYADLLAYRAMHYVDALASPTPQQRRYYKSQDKVPVTIENVLKNIEKIKNRMFFI